MHEMRVFARKNDLKASWTYYKQWGQKKAIPLRFSKSNNPDIEKWYATHFISNKTIKTLKEQRPTKLIEEPSAE